MEKVSVEFTLGCCKYSLFPPLCCLRAIVKLEGMENGECCRSGVRPH